MSIDTINALNAYRNQMKMMQDASESSDSGSGGGQVSFLEMAQGLFKSNVETQKQSEAVQLQALTGKAELTDLVTAVAGAELSLNTVVAVRDRVINAYNDILKMTI